MSWIYVLCLIILSHGAMAREERIMVSTPAPGLFYGSIQRLEPELKQRLLVAAKKSCGSSETLMSIYDVSVTFSFDSLSPSGSHFSGSYPVAQASATINCQE